MEAEKEESVIGRAPGPRAGAAFRAIVGTPHPDLVIPAARSHPPILMMSVAAFAGWGVATKKRQTGCLTCKPSPAATLAGTAARHFAHHYRHGMPGFALLRGRSRGRGQGHGPRNPCPAPITPEMSCEPPNHQVQGAPVDDSTQSFGVLCATVLSLAVLVVRCVLRSPEAGFHCP